MEKKLTFWQAIKVWWSFLWRTWVLMIPVMLVWMALIALLFKGIPKTEPGGRPHLPASFWLLWLVMFVSMFALQVVSLRWALQTRWSDFRLEVRPTSEERPAGQSNIS